MADEQKYAFQQPKESPSGTIANEDWVLIYGDPSGSQNMLNITFKSIIIWIWKKLTNQDGRGNNDFVLTNNDAFASITAKNTARDNLGAKAKYLVWKRNFTSAGGASRDVATLLPTPVNYDVLLLKNRDWFKLPLIADTNSLQDGQELIIVRENQSVSPAIRSDELYNWSDSAFYHAYSAMKLIYDSIEDRWRVIEANYIN